MRREAHHRQNWWSKGEWTDTLVYAMLASDRGGGGAIYDGEGNVSSGRTASGPVAKEKSPTCASWRGVGDAVM